MLQYDIDAIGIPKICKIHMNFDRNLNNGKLTQLKLGRYQAVFCPN
jgi:hypothetical protein